MNFSNSITSSNKYIRLSLQDYEFIIREVTKHDALHNGKKRDTGRTSLIRSIASHLNTSVSNVYSILKDASISVLNSDLSSRFELSASTAFSKRSKRHKPSNAFKLRKAQDFVNLVCDEVLSNPLSSIDETIHSLILHQPERIKGMTTISTKTFYT